MLTPEDRLDILEVVSRADDAATRRDADAYVTLFTEDAILDGQKGVNTTAGAIAPGGRAHLGI